MSPLYIQGFHASHILASQIESGKFKCKVNQLTDFFVSCKDTESMQLHGNIAKVD